MKKKKIIVSMADIDAIEVRENHRLAPRYGTDQLSFKSLVVKEQEVIQQCEKILKEKNFPLIIQKLIDFGTFEKEEDKDAKLSDFFVVLLKTKKLLDEGFHVLIVTSMLGCAGGRKSQLGYGTFDEKFTQAATDLDCRKDFWGTIHLLPIELVRTLLIDFMRITDLDNMCEDILKKSEVVLSFYSPNENTAKLEDFIKFCKQ